MIFIIFFSLLGEPLTFIGNQPRDWFNPLNWNFLENNKVAPWNDGTLYMDRIPCINDQLYFPEVSILTFLMSGLNKVF